MVRFIFLIENKHAPISNQEKRKYENKDKCFVLHSVCQNLIKGTSKYKIMLEFSVITFFY